MTFCVGHLREFQEKRSVLAFKIRVVQDPAEAEYHKHLATYVHLYNTYGPLPDVDAGAGATTAAAPGVQVVCLVCSMNDDGLII
jgi:hypothetical protein